MRYAMAVDTKKCVGCSDCVVACQTENNVPIGYCRDWIVEVVDGSYPNVEIELRSERCNHCDNSPCVRCCPTGASHIAEGGIVLVTHNECIGCGACIEACPFAPSRTKMHPAQNVAISCDLCMDRAEGPLCVAYCAMRALAYVPKESRGDQDG